MAIIVSDNFNRANNPTSMGTAPTGQTWELVATNDGIGDPFGILSNEAFWNNTGAAGLSESYVVVDAGLSDTKGSVRIMDVTAGGGLNLRNQGMVLRYVDSSHFIFCAYFNASGTTGFRVYIADGGEPIARGFGAFFTMVDGDTMGYACCGQTIQFFHNDILKCEGFVGPMLSPTLLAGTKFGLMASLGVITPPNPQRYEDFLVETNGTCTPTYNCTLAGCVDPGDGTGTYATLAACEAACSVPVSYNCVDGVCVDPGNGTGVYTTLEQCQASGCGVVTTNDIDTARIDAGTGSSWYVVAPISDSGDELRSKTVKAVRVTGKVTNASVMLYGYDVSDPIVVSNLENGVTSTTGALALPDTTNVAQSPRIQTNVTNAVLHTVRVEGNDTGQTTRDRVDEIVTEQSSIGVRR